MQATNAITNFLIKVADQNITDIHTTETQIYVRTANWDIEYIKDFSITKDDVMSFIGSILPSERQGLMVEQKEFDIWFWLGPHRYRVNVYEDMKWIRLSIRKVMAKIPTLEEIGVPETFKPTLDKDSGLILVTWPTGSWKSTTIASMIEYINQKRKCHIITLEDPIEYVYQQKQALITQRQIIDNSPDWWSALRNAMRENPDVIMVWEMRDRESIEAVLTIVETGHLVLSTLHTSDASQTVSRIIDVFPPEQKEQICLQLSMSLSVVMAQKLLPTADKSWRIVAREIMYNIPAVAANIRSNRVHQLPAIIETGSKFGMMSMDYSLAYLLNAGYITRETVMSKIKNPETFELLLNSIKSWWTLN